MAHPATNTSSYSLDRAPTPNDKSKRRILATLALLAVGAVVGAVLVIGRAPLSTAAASTTTIAVGSSNGGGVGVCYFLGTDNTTTISSDFAKIKERFGAVRTYQTASSGSNLIEMATQAGLQIHAGVSINDRDQGDRDIQAIVDGLKRHPTTLLSVSTYGKAPEYDWDHNLGGTQRRVLKDATTTISLAKQAIQRLRAAAAAANVEADLPPIAMVQEDQDWLMVEANEIVSTVDIIGVVIQPYYGTMDASTIPIQDLTSRWNAIVQAYPTKKVVLAGTGWPTNGPIVNGYYPGMFLAQKFVSDALAWFSTGGGGVVPSLFAFQYVDMNRANFGLVNQAKQWKFDFTAPRSKFVTPRVAFANVDAKVVLGVNDALNDVSLIDWNGWTRDAKRVWIQRGDQIYSGASSRTVLLCMGIESFKKSHESLSGIPLGATTCSNSDSSQSWAYNSATKQLEHMGQVGYCLTAMPSSLRPTLSKCAASGSPQFSSQQFELWSV
ncbi:Aste57867_9741 [Aphanomyces stellatus]|uniref:glucan endo-1,3-beta-D-glucosidase n=1 Tax=Aphanomyces stellatus TaxID=120398 RepID=A0A485KP28_9STRA|nr:hypothetical protein As57867_009702 [Aphanomyces stellatus]VFT86620.1 Aste57867_9741 [Aphanomyces stellatus]